jgi:hypothetical protein
VQQQELALARLGVDLGWGLQEEGEAREQLQ